MYKSLLVLVTLGLSACGQQTPSSQSQAAGAVRKTHTAASVSKGRILQPAVRQRNIADASSLVISFHGCADLLLTDPRGHKLGYDPTSKKSYLEIPGGIYDEGDLIGDDEANQEGQEKTAGKQPDCMADKTVQFPNPLPGMYTLKMFGNGVARFKLEITRCGADAKVNGHYVTSQVVFRGAAVLSIRIATVLRHGFSGESCFKIRTGAQALVRPTISRTILAANA